MFDSTLHAKTISRQLRATDFHSALWTLTPETRGAVIQEAVERARDGFQTVSLRRGEIGGKYVYQHSSLSEALVIRQISEGIRRLTNVRQSDRQAIVRSLIALLHEGVPFQIFRMDVKSFYETIDPDAIVASLRADPGFSRQSVQVLRTFFRALEAAGIEGLPRGIGLSATLAEYAMRNFDKVMSEQKGVRLYSRYVDDGIVVASAEANTDEIRSVAEASLPSGLKLNRLKTKPFKFSSFNRNNSDSTEHRVEFLGYCLDVGRAVRIGDQIQRTVRADIRNSKVDRIKLRLAKAFIAFQNDNNFDLLHGRVKLLTSNFGYIDHATGQQRFSGLRYNYSLIDPIHSQSLPALDRFLRNTLTSPHPNNRIRPNLTREQRNKLLGFGFYSGFIENRFFSFDRETVSELTRCWAHA